MTAETRAEPFGPRGRLAGGPLGEACPLCLSLRERWNSPNSSEPPPSVLGPPNVAFFMLDYVVRPEGPMGAPGGWRPSPSTAGPSKDGPELDKSEAPCSAAWPLRGHPGAPGGQGAHQSVAVVHSRPTPALPAQCARVWAEPVWRVTWQGWGRGLEGAGGDGPGLSHCPA